MNDIVIQIDREEQIVFKSKSEANEYLMSIRDSGRYYCKIYLKEYESETIFLKYLSSICEEIMESASTQEGILIDIKLGEDGEMTLIQKICAKLEMEGLLEENEFRGKDLVHRLTKEGLSFWNDYKSLEWMRKRNKVKVKHNGLREKLGIYNIR